MNMLPNNLPVFQGNNASMSTAYLHRPLGSGAAQTAFSTALPTYSTPNLQQVPPGMQSVVAGEAITMPTQPQSLTRGMINPQQVAMQKDIYTKSLDEQQRQGAILLTQRTTQQREYIRMHAEQQKVLVNGQLDQQLQAQVMRAEQEYQQQLATLTEAARQQKLGLHQQASQLIMEYNK